MATAWLCAGGEAESDSEGVMSEDEDEKLAIEKHNKLLEKARSATRLNPAAGSLAGHYDPAPQQKCCRLLSSCP